jgi:hypothetical protein
MRMPKNYDGGGTPPKQKYPLKPVYDPMVTSVPKPTVRKHTLYHYKRGAK